MKAFTKKQLVHTAIFNIRIRLKMYGDTGKLKYIKNANEQAGFLYDMEIIDLGKKRLLCDIINREFRRLLEKSTEIRSQTDE